MVMMHRIFHVDHVRSRRLAAALVVLGCLPIMGVMCSVAMASMMGEDDRPRSRARRPRTKAQNKTAGASSARSHGIRTVASFNAGAALPRASTDAARRRCGGQRVMGGAPSGLFGLAISMMHLRRADVVLPMARLRGEAAACRRPTRADAHRHDARSWTRSWCRC